MVELIWDNKQKMLKELGDMLNSEPNCRFEIDRDSSKDVGTTGNLYIEGDNLDALRLLREDYTGKVKMIYIDPPYNTEKKFVYRDKFRNNSKECRHSGWLNMMYPRLKLAKDLLRDDGVIFISIDDVELENLKKICNELYGEGNFIACVIWERAYSPVNLKKHFSESHDFILCYAKSIEQLNCNGLKRSDEANDRYSNPDNDERGVWKSSDLSVGPAVQNNIYEITTPSGRKAMPPSGYSWRLSRDKFDEFVRDNRIWFGVDGSNVPSIKRFLNEVKQGITPMTVWKYADVGHSQKASQDLKKLFDNNAFFTYPKPVELIQRLLELYSNNDSMILDFFSGSATTAHAVMQLNAEDGGNRKFIMVQLPEPCDGKSEAYKAGYKNICEIGKERIRRAGEKIKEEVIAKGKDKQTPDIGFKVLTVIKNEN